jgi:hypothetical protein
VQGRIDLVDGAFWGRNPQQELAWLRANAPVSRQAVAGGEVPRPDDGSVRILKIDRDTTRIIKSLMRAGERDAIATARRREDDACARLFGR